MTFDEQSVEYRQCIEKYLDEQCFLYDSEPQKHLFDAMRYSLLSGGKRLRPIMVFDFCKMCGGNWQDAVHFAAALEMVHTYSLIHDDLPCMDNDDYRRGRLTNHKIYGEAIAVLAGDALLTAAFAHLVKANCCDTAKVKAVNLLANLAGETGMVGGQVLDILSEERLCTEQEVINIQTRKTGALIRAACALGVIAGNGTDAQLESAHAFADSLGLAFQIRDDMLDVIGDSTELGKAVGVDTGKNTFVRLYGIKKCDFLVRSYTQKAIDSLSVFNHTEYMTQLALKLTGRTV